MILNQGTYLLNSLTKFELPLMNAAIAPIKKMEQESSAPVMRDLKFHPSQTTDPQTLTREQITRFNRDGFLSGIRVFNNQECDENRRYFDALLAKAQAAGADSYSLSGAHLTYGRVYDLLTNPKLLALVRDLLGSDFVAWGSHYFCKMPHDGRPVSWHQDASYWALSPCKAVTIWLAIDDADRHNACMKFIAGSHHLGHLTYRYSDEGEKNVLNQAVDDAEQLGEVVWNELLAGEVSLHSDLLLHASDPNNSDRRRCGIALRYCAADVRANAGLNERRLVVSGADPSNHWANPPRPNLD